MTSTWRVKGQPLKVVHLSRHGSGARLNLLGFVEYATGDVGYREVVGHTTGADVVALLDDLASVSTPRCPTIVILDNASVHRNALVASRLGEWKAQGFRQGLLGFLPAYCPHLNRMEAARPGRCRSGQDDQWRKLKYHLLPRRRYEGQDQLRQDVQQVWGRAV